MNIFVLDRNPRQAARDHCDKHVNKMILESAQMLCSALNFISQDQITPYKTTHLKHPCTQWVLTSRSNAAWLLDLAGELNIEWRKRNGHPATRQHKSWEVMYSIQHLVSLLPHTNGVTPFAQAMPDEYKNPNDPIAAYRAYYHTKTFAEWQKTPVPYWYQRG